MTKREDVAIKTVPAKDVAPVDPGDAHGLGNEDRRSIDPALLHEDVDTKLARGDTFTVVNRAAAYLALSKDGADPGAS